MKDKIFGVLQRVGRSFMLPIALLPVAGILLGLGSVFTNETTLSTYHLTAVFGEGTLDAAGQVLAAREVVFQLHGIGDGVADSVQYALAGNAAFKGAFFFAVPVFEINDQFEAVFAAACGELDRNVNVHSADAPV